MNTKKCLVCGRVFKKSYRRSYKSWKTAKYCSMGCYQKVIDKKLLQKKGRDAWRGKHHTDEWKQRHRKRMTGKNNPFYGKKHSLEVREKISKALKGKYIGEKSPTWKGGISGLRKAIKENIRYSKWRMNVFKRDNFICQKCGQKGKNIEAHHHLKSFADILKEYRVKTIKDAIKCNELWDINNGITWCVECHNEQHIYLKNLKNRNKTKVINSINAKPNNNN